MAFNPDVFAHAETRYGPAFEAGSELQPIQPPHPSLAVDTPSGYPEDSGTIMDDVNTPDIADIYRD